MNLGIFLPIGSSFQDLKKSGQDQRFINYYLKKYQKHFKKIYIFSYKKEKVKLPKNCFLIANHYQLHRFFYSFFMPFMRRRIIQNIDIFRVMQLNGVLPAVLAKVLYNKKFIFTYGYDYLSMARLRRQWLAVILLKILELLAFKFGSGAIIPVKAILQNLKKKYPYFNLYYLPNGVDINRFKFKSSKLKTAGKSQKLIRLLFVGRLEKEKNLINLLKAVSFLKNKYKIKLFFIGQGSYKEKLIKTGKELEVNLKIVKPVPHSQLVGFYHQADIFCLPSYLEGNSKVLLEAMACGLPCLVGKYPTIREFRNRFELLLTGFKAKEISRQLEKLINNYSLRQKLGLNARKKIEKFFDIKKILKKEINILKNFVDSKNLK